MGPAPAARHGAVVGGAETTHSSRGGEPICPNHFTRSFTTCHDDDDINGRIACDQALQYGLAGAERSGNTGGAALSDRVEGIDDPCGGDHRFCWKPAFRVAMSQ